MFLIPNKLPNENKFFSCDFHFKQALDTNKNTNKTLDTNKNKTHNKFVLALDTNENKMKIKLNKFLISMKIKLKNLCINHAYELQIHLPLFVNHQQRGKQNRYRFFFP